VEWHVKLKQLLKEIEGVIVHGSREIEITGIASDSRVVAPGFIFIARPGEKRDGREYISQAIEAGAKVIVTDLYDPFLSVSQVICKSPVSMEAVLSAKYYGYPSKKLFTVGITGSKGKTTTSYLVRHLLEGLGNPCGLMNTIETIIREDRFPSQMTTQSVIFNQKVLKEMVHQQCAAAVLEVSSHGLVQGRVDEIAFDIGIFTNLYPDHLDYHKTIEEYAVAKAKLFKAVDGTSIFNADSSWSKKMQQEKKGILFGIDHPADLHAEQIVCTERGLEFSVQGVRFSSCLMGRFNVYNLLSAIAVGVIKGASLEEMSSVLATFPGVPGRLERVANSRGVHVFVDYAHTGESLESVLRTLRDFTKQKMIVVFGCGGNRDPQRRKSMAESAEKYADLSIVTTDNPRNEDPEAIVRDIVAGYKSSEHVIVELDRKKAIIQAIQEAQKGDIVLIAGKGHEKVQIFKDRTIAFDDVSIASEFQ